MLRSVSGEDEIDAMVEMSASADIFFTFSFFFGCSKRVQNNVTRFISKRRVRLGSTCPSISSAYSFLCRVLFAEIVAPWRDALLYQLPNMI